MARFDQAQLKDRIYACWMGKNIGGTIGGPFEHNTNILDIKGFTTEPGESLVNDDLDLQLVWLLAAENLGPRMINERVLGEYWLTYITPHWNEYGVCKSNMRDGFMPPISGELTNYQWKDSNGAWIRTEIWACLFPGLPDRAVKFAYYDACVDHGFGEGTYSAIFVAAMQSAAFVINDLRTLLDIGLSKIPADTKTAQSVRLVIDEFDKGTDWKEIREKVIEFNRDFGWFQAPLNIAFAVIGLLYGEGDFKKSMLTAVNCGDDTDCTAATVGALLGIMNGTAGIPEDWKQYIGDKITVGCLLHGHAKYPKTCTELTARVMNIQREALRGTKHWLSSEENDFSDIDAESMKGSKFADELGKRSKYSFEAENVLVNALIELDREPSISPMGTLTGKITLKNAFVPSFDFPLLHGQRRYRLRWLCQDGFTVSSDLDLQCHLLNTREYRGTTSYIEPAIGHFTITAPEKVEAMQNIVLEITSPGRFTPLYVSIPVMGMQ